MDRPTSGSAASRLGSDRHSGQEFESDVVLLDDSGPKLERTIPPNRPASSEHTDG